MMFWEIVLASAIGAFITATVIVCMAWIADRFEIRIVRRRKRDKR